MSGPEGLECEFHENWHVCIHCLSDLVVELREARDNALRMSHAADRRRVVLHEENQELKEENRGLKALLSEITRHFILTPKIDGSDEADAMVAKHLAEHDKRQFENKKKITKKG